MARRILSVLIIVLLISLHFFLLGSLTEEKKSLPRSEESSYVLPSAVLKLISLDFKGVASDFLFLKAVVFYGSTFERTETPRVKAWEWTWLFNALKASTDLDPYFFDPYYVANSLLPWEGHMVHETNDLLEQGSRLRYWDWKLPFYIGFNYYYFLQDNAKASSYFMESAKRPDAGRVITTLAVRVAYKGSKTEGAILFLDEMYKSTKDESMKKEYLTRLKTLQDILSLEKSTELFRRRYGRTPRSLGELLERKIVSKIPTDPYGGDFYVDSEGHIKTTSDLLSIYTNRENTNNSR